MTYIILIIRDATCDKQFGEKFNKQKKKRSSIFLLFELVLKRISTPVDYNNNKYTYIISVDPRCDDDNYRY